MDQSAASGDDLLADARLAFERCDWVAVFEAYRAADLAASLELDDLERAAQAAFWIGEADASIEFRQRAFADCIAGDEERRAAGLAIDLVFDHAGRNRYAVAFGWLGRAERLLEGCEPCSELGRLVEVRAMEALEVTHDATVAVELYDEVLRIGRLTRDADLVAGALAGKGTALVRLGRVRDGLRLVDESMIDAVSGLLGPFATAKTYCVTIGLCQALGDIRRAGEWTEQAVACSSGPGMGDFPGDCQMHRAEITRLRGDWVAAESALHLAMESLERWDPRTLVRRGMRSARSSCGAVISRLPRLRSSGRSSMAMIRSPGSRSCASRKGTPGSPRHCCASRSTTRETATRSSSRSCYRRSSRLRSRAVT